MLAPDCDFAGVNILQSASFSDRGFEFIDDLLLFKDIGLRIASGGQDPGGGNGKNRRQEDAQHRLPGGFGEETTIRLHDGFEAVFDVFDGAGDGQGGNGPVLLEFLHEAVDDGRAILFGNGVQTGDSGFVAAFFAFLANLSVGPPDQRVEKEDGLDEQLQGVDGRVLPLDMGQFVHEYALSLPAGSLPFKSSGQINCALPKAPDKGLAVTFDFPYLRESPE